MAIAKDTRSVLDAYVRGGDRNMLQASLKLEEDVLLEEYAVKIDEHGRRLVVHTCYPPTQIIMPGAGPLEIGQPRAWDNPRRDDERVVFARMILPPYLLKSQSIEGLISWLHLKGVSKYAYAEAQQARLGLDAKGFSPNVIVRLKKKWGKQYEGSRQRDLSGEHHVLVWAKRIYGNVRLQNEANRRLSLLALIGATAEGRKELLAVIDGVRERKPSLQGLLLDLKQRGLSKPPKFAASDRALGLWAVLQDVYSTTKDQRYWVHKATNVLNQMPKALRAKTASDLHQIQLAETREMGTHAFLTTSSRSSMRRMRRHEVVSRRSAKSTSPSTTSPPSTGATCGPSLPVESTFSTIRLRHRLATDNG